MANQQNSMNTKYNPLNHLTILVPEEYFSWCLRIKDFISESAGEDASLYLKVLDGTIGRGRRQVVGADADAIALLEKEIDKEERIKQRTLRIIRSALPNNIYTRFHQINDAFELWTQLSLVYGGDKSQQSSKVTQLLSEFKTFSQKNDETIDSAFERYSMLLTRMDAAQVSLSQHIINISFLNSIKKDWLMIVVMLKNREDLKDLPLTQVFGILKGNEQSMINDSESVAAGSLALVAKSESSDDEEGSSDEDQRKIKAFVAVNPGAKKFFKKKFNNNNSRKFNNNNTSSQSS
ncbi:hypothetical protein E9993_22725, partial [Labilibacter sediminis]